MADFGKIFEQAQQMQARMQQMQSELEKQTVTAAAGGGMV
ncbi:MAG: YbaB/EbfC family nucleoid-associated protein, partial [Gemmatimonadaceae bacterium]